MIENTIIDNNRKKGGSNELKLLLKTMFNVGALYLVIIGVITSIIYGINEIIDDITDSKIRTELLKLTDNISKIQQKIIKEESIEQKDIQNLKKNYQKFCKLTEGIKNEDIIKIKEQTNKLLLENKIPITGGLRISFKNKKMKVKKKVSKKIINLNS